MSPDPLDWLLAHRGWPACYPENSLEGIDAVLAAGARQVEFDVQITADRHAVVVHDNNLRRLTGEGGRVTELTLDELGRRRLRPDRRSRIATLGETLALFDLHPRVTAFVELKRHSIEHFGHRQAVEIVTAALRQAPCPCVLISFDPLAPALAREQGIEFTGWVIRSWTPESHRQAERLAPDWLFIRADRVPDETRPFWPGPWRWVVYGVDALAEARRWRERGATLVEVDDLPGVTGVAHGR
ncbi:MAG: glycerophosphodiester phosphodiesterase [Pseudomonadota bacterium]|nr:MAG: glycerophosphodiester phosphodiesterase [Pseudomonadota bacterium]